MSTQRCGSFCLNFEKIELSLYLDVTNSVNTNLCQKGCKSHISLTCNNRGILSPPLVIPSLGYSAGSTQANQFCLPQEIFILLGN